jgi:hypothetical protein
MLKFAGVAVAALVLVGCATAPGGMKAGQFVSYQCTTGKGFQARYNPEAKSVRVRALHGAVELSQTAEGKFAGEDYMLDTTTQGGPTLMHKGKAEASGCKAG